MRKIRSLTWVLIILSLISLNLSTYLGIYSTYAQDEVDVTLYVSGGSSKGGPIFQQLGNIGGKGYWSPGKIATGTLRIYNNYSERVRISSLGLKMKLEKKLSNGQYEVVKDKSLYELYAKNMKLAIKKGELPVFSNTIYDESFYEMLHGKVEFTEESKAIQVNYEGFSLGALDKFNIGKNGYVDLEYTVRMDEKSGNEMQGLRATVDFLLNVDENPETNDGGNEDDNGTIKVASIDDEQWYHDCIKTLLDEEIIQGYPHKAMKIEDYRNGTVKPEVYIEVAVKPQENITRAEAAMLIGKALKLEEVEKFFSGYIDGVPDWAKGYILATTEKDIFEGYPGKLFKANNNITREEMTAILIRGFEKKYEKEIELGFIDKDEIAKWAAEYIKSAVENDVIQGYPDNTFKPKDYITRAEAFTIICKLLGYHETH